ncbi:MAG: TatD family hydrolase [Treponema sp.]|nr:TatD family hydrolase [Treponema sp.]
MGLVDVAVNLTGAAFDGDRAEVARRAREAGVAALVVTASGLEDSARALDLAREIEGCVATVGVHPHNAREWDAGASPARLRALALSEGPAPVAIGECGLDYNRNFSPQAAQRKCFEDQLEIAAELGLPAFLHERDAFDDFHSILKQRRADLPGALVHCFTGGARELEAYLALDCYIGITGWICDERRGERLIELARDIPCDRLLLETDSPYLLPRTMPRALRPKNGRNEPAFLVQVAAFVAQALGKSAEELAAQTGANAARLFGALPGNAFGP